jgi:hypothetical protein
LLHF